MALISIATADSTRLPGFTDRLQTSFAQVFGQTLPALIGALVILFAGYLLAKVLEKLDRARAAAHPTRTPARARRRDAGRRALRHASQSDAGPREPGLLAGDVRRDPARGERARARVAGERRVELVSYIPSVIAAIVIILLGIVLGGFVGGLIGASAGAVHGGRALARIGRGGVILLAIFMALQELGIATDIVTTAFAILFGAIALALALSFGLGNRELAGEITREWYERYRRERAEAIAREHREAQAEAEIIAEEESLSAGGRSSDTSIPKARIPPRRIWITTRRSNVGRARGQLAALRNDLVGFSRSQE